MTNMIQSQPLAPHELPLRRQLELLGTQRMIDLICDLDQRVGLLERQLVTTCAGPAGLSLPAARTPVLKCPQTAQDGPGRAQPPEPV